MSHEILRIYNAMSLRICFRELLFPGHKTPHYEVSRLSRARNEPNSVIYVQNVVLVVLIRVQAAKSVRVPVTGDISIPCLKLCLQLFQTISSTEDTCSFSIIS